VSARTGKVNGQLDGLTRELLCTALHALSMPRGAEDDRSAWHRRGDALGEICQRVLDSGDLPQCGGERPHLNVIIGLAELGRRTRAASRFRGAVASGGSAGVLACDARVLPIVMNGARAAAGCGPGAADGPRRVSRAVAARDRDCARPGCGRPTSWCELHHIISWEDGGESASTTV
jgi:5-methylcytosine-specific restriction protein A